MSDDRKNLRAMNQYKRIRRVALFITIALATLILLMSCTVTNQDYEVETTVISKSIGDGEDSFIKRYGLLALSNGESLQPKYGIYSLLNVGDTLILRYNSLNTLVAVRIPKVHKGFYEVVDRKYYSKNGYMFEFKLYFHAKGSRIKEVTHLSNANWEVGDIVKVLK